MKGTMFINAFLVVLEMARAGRKQVGPIAKWWNSQRENHFQIIGMITIFSLAVLLWTFSFLFILGGTTDPDRENLVPYYWLGLALSIPILFLSAPEFMFFLNQKQILEDILKLESRSEVLKNRKEAESAADLLGGKYVARLKGLYEELGIKVKGKRFSIKSLPSKRISNKVENMDEEE
ncbi:MAG: hypothetical protein ACKVHF_00595 [Candidatus Poseidoniales archaeon]|jgi:hypothetical protein|tara:strand:+ start:1470 stop:2003 length:534 start_codon:yes stop_codon:yes gene_type:complete